jgi:hypothetical protein
LVTICGELRHKKKAKGNLSHHFGAARHAGSAEVWWDVVCVRIGELLIELSEYHAMRVSV